jgi:hypothetical protein
MKISKNFLLDRSSFYLVWALSPKEEQDVGDECSSSQQFRPYFYIKKLYIQRRKVPSNWEVK